MPDLPKKKVGIVACSGEERVEGTVTRLASLRVLEQMRPGETVTICLPLFLAGGRGDRAFARFYPTIAVDGCEKRCAAQATELYSGKPAASIVATDVIADGVDLGTPRRLSETGLQTAKAVAQVVASQVDDLLAARGMHRGGERAESAGVAGSGSLGQETQEAIEATCSCGSGIPVLTLSLNGRRETLLAVPAIFEQLYVEGKRPNSPEVTEQLMRGVRLYNAIADAEESIYREALMKAFEGFCRSREA